MSAVRSAERDCIFTPQAQVVSIVDAYHGLLDLDTLPSYYQPRPVAYELAAKVITLASKSDSGVNLLFEGDDSDYDIESSLKGRPFQCFGLSLVIGPANLRQMVDDVSEGNPLLWDRGTVADYWLRNRRASLSEQINSIYGYSEEGRQ